MHNSSSTHRGGVTQGRDPTLGLDMLVQIEDEIDELRDAFASRRSRCNLCLLGGLLVACAVFAPLGLTWVGSAVGVILIGYGVFSVSAERQLNRQEDEARARVSYRR